jgi:glycolate oxidase FAD binding subunit
MDPELVMLRERVLAAKATRTPLQLRGAGTKDFYGESITGELLDVAGYRGVIDYEPSELVISARCGTSLTEIETTLAERNQFLAFEPPRFEGDPTIGGMVASGLSGPRRMQVGATRDFVLGATLLGSDGELLRFGGRVMKNVAGFDVSRLLCGSLGIFGIITELSVKVLPKPPVEETVRLELREHEAIEAFNRFAGKPLPVSGASWYEGAAWIRLSGAEPAVKAARATIGGDRVFPVLATRWWNALRHHTHPLFSDTSVWRLSVPPTTPTFKLPTEPLIDWGGALRWYSVPEDTQGASALDADLRGSESCGADRRTADVRGIDIRGLAANAGGTALRWRGTGTESRFHPLAPAVLEIHKRLKRSFDPEGIFNPGRLLAGL